MRTFKIVEEIELNDDQVKYLLDIHREGYAEYRDSDYEDLEAFKKSDIYDVNGVRNDDWFNERNFNGTYQLSQNLLGLDLIDYVEDAWHITYEITDKGKMLLEQNGLLS